MNRRLLVVAGLFLVITGSIVWYSSNRPHRLGETSTASPAPAAPAPSAAPPASAAAVPEPAPERDATAPARTSRRVAARKDAAPDAEPAAAATLATFHIASAVAGAQVFIDRNYIGVTPVTSPGLAPGPHRINIVAQGYESIAENVDVEAGSRDLQFNFKEVRLDAAIDVVHKHRLGSCKGRLVATPQGLRYDTDDKDDRFTLALTDLEQFEVDYLAKILKVKGIKGKRYDFSDPAAANGDRLFVFHRDVDKARQRLK